MGTRTATGTVLLALLASAFAWPASSQAAQRAEPRDYVQVTKVMVNRIGGVTVEGTMSCSATAVNVRAGDVAGDDMATEEIEQMPIIVSPTDRLVLLTNPDRYVVSQPVGRRAMIQASHQPSKLNPCFTEVASLPAGALECAVGMACPWRTDRFGWDYASLGPLFDYSPSGTFKAGLLNVDGNSTDLAVIVLRQDGSTSTYMVEEGFFQTYSPVIRATVARASTLAKPPLGGAAALLPHLDSNQEPCD